MNRRQFLLLATGTGGMAALGAFTLIPKGLQRAERSSRALGTEVSMTALHESGETARRAIDAAFDELELVEEIMSIYRPRSQLSRLNRDGVLEDPHPYLVSVLKTAKRVSEQTGGRFDVTVQPLWETYAEAKAEGRLPDAAAIQKAKSKVDYRNIEISPDRIRFRRSGMKITLNGIAQGFASDRARAAFEKHGVEHALINTGEIGTMGRKEDGAKWKVGVQHPRRADAYVALAEIEGRFMATSGDYATSFSPDFRHNHILDPSTGSSPDGLSSVTVLTPSGVDADALSTAVFLVGIDPGLKLIEATPGADALFVRKDGRVLTTDGFPRA